MGVINHLVCLIVMWTVKSQALQEVSKQENMDNSLDLQDRPRQLNPVLGLLGVPTSASPDLVATTMATVQNWSEAIVADGFSEGRERKKKYKKHEMMMLTKLMMGLKVVLLGVVLPLAVIAAKVLSWKAVTLSLLAYMLAKIVFVKNLFMNKSPTPAPPSPSPSPAQPIIIHSSGPSHESLWKRHSPPKIHLQPEVHVHQGHQQGEEHHTPSWSWAEESRGSTDPHMLAFSNWLPKLTQTA